MLMKYTQVSSSGEVKEPPLKQLSYGALVLGRVTMIMGKYDIWISISRRKISKEFFTDSAEFSKLALTIGIRYGAVRRQFSYSNDKEERQILNYFNYQYRLFTRLSMTFAMHFTAQKMKKLHENLVLQMSSHSETTDMSYIINSLKEIHATSAGLKAFCTLVINLIISYLLLLLSFFLKVGIV
jgi:acyl-CoA oxidase